MSVDGRGEPERSSVGGESGTRWRMSGPASQPISLASSSTVHSRESSVPRIWARCYWIVAARPGVGADQVWLEADLGGNVDDCLSGYVAGVAGKALLQLEVLDEHGEAEMHGPGLLGDQPRSSVGSNSWPPVPQRMGPPGRPPYVNDLSLGGEPCLPRTGWCVGSHEGSVSFRRIYHVGGVRTARSSPLGPTLLTATRGRPKSRTLTSRPC